LFGNKRGIVLSLLQRTLSSIPHLMKSTSAKCLFCSGPISQTVRFNFMGLCSPCINSIPWIKEVKCNICGRYEECDDCKRRKDTFFNRNRSAVQYSDDMRKWLARYKYRGDEKLLPLFVEMLRYPYETLVQELSSNLDKKFDLITYIPLSTERLAERGFNQAEQFAKGLGKLYQTPVLPLLERTHHTGKQSYKTRGQRLKDLQGAFAFNANEISSEMLCHNRGRPTNILLIDDVYTTGSTLNQGASVISKHVSAQVFGLTWAR
jgi:competence protein ComFC